MLVRPACDIAGVVEEFKDGPVEVSLPAPLYDLPRGEDVVCFQQSTKDFLIRQVRGNLIQAFVQSVFVEFPQAVFDAVYWRDVVRGPAGFQLRFVWRRS